MTTTTIAGTKVPENHLATSLPSPQGTYWLYGFRAWNGTARFTLILDSTLNVIVDGADWPTTWAALVERVKPAYVESYLRSVLPEEDEGDRPDPMFTRNPSTSIVRE